MRGVIRADATPAIGTGHVMRCIALAQAWREVGVSTRFVTHCPSPQLQRRIQDAGAELVLLEAATSASAVRIDDADWLVVDGYHLALPGKEAPASTRVMVLDDYGHRPRYDADVILNQNLGANAASYATQRPARVLAGTQYALLRREFWDPVQRRSVPDRARRILVTLGGGDPDNATSRVVEGLASLHDATLEVVVLLGAASPHAASIEAAVAQNLPKGRAIVNTPDVREIMEWTDLAVCASGTTIWELCRMGVPAIAMTIADNQVALSKELARRGLIRDLGWHTDVSARDVAEAVEKLSASPEARQAAADTMMRLVDGQGARRVVAELDRVPGIEKS